MYVLSRHCPAAHLHRAFIVLASLCLTVSSTSAAASVAVTVSGDIDVTALTQEGEVANCGPTAAAMLLGHRVASVRPDALRDAIGHWSWRRFPLRHFRLPGHEPGMTTPAMMREILKAFGGRGRVQTLKHPVLPPEAWALLALRDLIKRGSPVLLMVESPVLWGTSQPGLHWIVVRGLDGDAFLFNDPADGSVQTVSAERLWRAWRLHPLWHRLPGVHPFTAFTLEDIRTLDPLGVRVAHHGGARH